MSKPRLVDPASSPLEADEYIDNPTDDDYATAARWALQQKDFRLAVKQASAAVCLRPLHEPHLRLLDEVIARARAPLALLALPDGAIFFGLVAARARALARLERFDEALRALFEVAAFRPDIPFLRWAPAWVAAAKAAKRVAPETVAEGLSALGEAMSDRPLSEGARANLEAALDVAERVQARHPPSEALAAATARIGGVLG